MTCFCEPRTVRLLLDRRSFRCAYCFCLCRHPFFDPFYNILGHAYCYFCGMWMKIENPGEQLLASEVWGIEEG
jgi:hypothetical protein